MKEAQAKNTHCSVFNNLFKLQIRRMSAEICDNTLRPYLFGCPIAMGRSKLNKDRLHRSRCSPCSFRNREFSIYSVAVIAFCCITLPSNELPLKLKRYYIYLFYMKTRISDRMSISIFVD